MTTLLKVRDLVAGYGSHAVLHGVSYEVAEGEAVAMVGLNGAGKSVSLRCVNGLLMPWQGSVEFADVDVTRSSPEARVQLGMATVPQGRGIFPDLSVEQNLRLGGFRLAGSEYRDREEKAVERFPRLGERRRQTAGTLSGGEQAMLAVARSLISEPRLLVLDEPTAGLAPAIAQQMTEMLAKLNQEGMTILIVEQNVGVALKLATRVLLMQKGLIVRTTSPDDLQDRGALLSQLGAGELYAGDRK
jgi:branched-chain amino acid transport system ATP-binding protein